MSINIPRCGVCSARFGATCYVTEFLYETDDGTMGTTYIARCHGDEEIQVLTYEQKIGIKGLEMAVAFPSPLMIEHYKKERRTHTKANG